MGLDNRGDRGHSTDVYNPSLTSQKGTQMDITIDARTIRARQFAAQIMAIIGDCVSDKDGAQSRLIDAAYRTNAKIVTEDASKR